MNIIHVVPHINEEASGPSYSVPRLCQALAERGHEVELSCLSAGREIPEVKLDVHRQWPFLKRFAVAPSHPRALRRKAAEVDIIHNHSLWSMVNVAAGWTAPGRKAKLVTSPRGTLSDWALSRRPRLKQVLWPLQKRALSRADLLHATSEAECRDMRNAGLRAPVVIAPNGIDLPATRARGLPEAGDQTLLFLGRLHPTKCVDRLLHAWATLEASHPAWRLVIAGIGASDHESELHSLARQLELDSVRFVGPLYGEAKSEAYWNADLYILPSHSENFGMTVAESLAHACPVVVSKGAPWEGVVEQGCGWWVDNDIESLVSTLREAMSLSPKRLETMGEKGRHWVQKTFSWDSIAQEMEAAYLWLLGHGEMPERIFCHRAEAILEEQP